MATANQIIVPHLWYNKEAVEAAKLYTSIFPNSKITGETVLNDTPSGDARVVSFELIGQKFMAINGGPYFTFNPSISFFVQFNSSADADASEKLEAAWKKLLEGGKVLMPLDTYPFSKKYGWIQDKYGLSWQLFLANQKEEERQYIMPSFMFAGEKYGQAEEAIQFYVSVFRNAKQGHLERYPKGMEPDKEGAIMYADFCLENQWFAAMESARSHDFQFNEAVSFMVYCDTQEEIDYYWDKLSAVPEAEQCGWLKDKFGVSWQIVPKEMDKLMANGTPEQINRVNQVILKMKKLNLEEIHKAYQEG